MDQWHFKAPVVAADLDIDENIFYNADQTAFKMYSTFMVPRNCIAPRGCLKEVPLSVDDTAPRLALAGWFSYNRISIYTNI